MRNAKILRWLLGIVAGIIVVYFLLNLYVKNRLIAELSQLEEVVTFEELRVSLVRNTFILTKFQTRQDAVAISAQKVRISGVSYFHLLGKDQISVRKIEVDKPQIVLYQRDSSRTDGHQGRQLEVGSLLLKNGSLYQKAEDTSKVALHVSFPEVELTGISYSEEINLEGYSVKSDSIYFRLNAEHFIDIGNADAEDGRIHLSDFRIVPFDSKPEFDRKLSFEKDRIALQVDHIFLEDFLMREHQDTLMFANSSLSITGAFLEIYRNKLIKDDERQKTLYSEMLREAPIKLDFEQVVVEQSEIIYEELVQEGRESATIRFTDISATINHLHNLRSKASIDPSITAQARFNRGTPVNLTWTFPVFEVNNSFTISGDFGALEGEALDSFLIPSLDLRARGDINGVSFSFRGGEEMMTGSFFLDYDQLEVELLKEEGEEKRSFWSAIANLFIKNEAQPQAENDDIEVKRNQQRSFWNYMWLGLREGLLEKLSRI